MLKIFWTVDFVASVYHIYRLEIVNLLRTFRHVGIFQPSFVICCPSPLLSGSTLPPVSLPCVNKNMYVYSM